MTEALQALLLLLVVGSGTAAVAFRRPLRQAIMLGFHGTCLALLLLSLRAPDVALAQLAVGSMAVPLMLLTAVANAHRRPGPAPPEDGAGPGGPGRSEEPR